MIGIPIPHLVMQVSIDDRDHFSRLLVTLGWTENEIKRAQEEADGDFDEGIKLLLRETVLSSASARDEEGES